MFLPKHLTRGLTPLYCVSELYTINALTAIFCLSLQLGFGSFLGIIGAHLIENKRQMVRGFILPLCIEITLALEWCLPVCRLVERSHQTAHQSHWPYTALIKLLTLTIDTADPAQTPGTHSARGGFACLSKNPEATRGDEARNRKRV